MKYLNAEKSIGFLIYEVSRLMRRDFDARVQSLGLTQVQWRAIAHIAFQEGCNQTVLAELLEIKPITLTRLIDRHEEAGWVVRQPDSNARRATQLYLSDKARPLLATMREKSLQTLPRALKGISDAEITRQAATIARLNDFRLIVWITVASMALFFMLKGKAR